MDIISSVRSCLNNWSKGGEAQCRTLLQSPHQNIQDPECVDVLSTGYHTLVSAALDASPMISPETFVAFIQSVLQGLPSTSHGDNLVAFGEILVDMVWSVDLEIDEMLAAHKAALAQSTHASDHAAAKVATKVSDEALQSKGTLVSIVKLLLSACLVDPTICRERLDPGILAGIALTADKLQFEKKEVRIRTALFYKQNKFNLTREQSEGYSKLTTELASSLGPANLTSTGRPTEPYASIEQRARIVWEKVMSLNGHFYLDPNRALDLILDAFSIHLTTHYSFFLALLSMSPWAGAYTRPADGPIPPEQSAPRAGLSFDEILQQTESHVAAYRGPVLAAPKNKSNHGVLAQILGFKFAYYQNIDGGQTVPKNLFLTVALLIREGFVAIEDLYPHLTPDDSEMEVAHKEYLAEVKSRIEAVKTGSQLAMAAPLGSSAPTTSSGSTESKKPTEVTALLNQKVGLLIALLSVGAFRPAVSILTRFPWVVDAFPQIADLLINTIKVSLAPLFAEKVIKKTFASFTQPKPQYSARNGLLPPPAKKYHLTTFAPTPPGTATTDFVFFFPDWLERVPVCSAMDDVEHVIEPLLLLTGVHISRDISLFSKFVRLGRQHIGTTLPNPNPKEPESWIGDPTNPIVGFWRRILRRVILPAIPLLRGNALCAVDVFNIMRSFETTERWQLYGEWKSSYVHHPELRVRRAQAERESKGLLRRLTHDNMESLSGTVAKLTHSDPCIFFSNAITQVMSYDNMGGVVIQALLYSTSLGMDVLVYTILDALSNPNKERLKEDGVNTSDWLQSLASFTGAFFARYGIDLSPVLKYLVHQLQAGQTSEIVVLRELIWKMAGIEPLPSLSEAQIAAMAGGPSLRIEAVASSARGARLDPVVVAHKAPKRLGTTLLNTSLALPILLQVAQQRQACVFKVQDAYLKSLAGLYDSTHGVLLQYLDLLNTPEIISPNDYADKILPSLQDLGDKYGIRAPICMQIIRPVLNAKLLVRALAFEKESKVAAAEAEEDSVLKEKRLKAALTAKREPTSRGASPATLSAKLPGDSQEALSDENKVEDSAMAVDVVSAVVSKQAPPPESPWIPELLTLFPEVANFAPVDVIGPAFYVTFWQMSTYDLMVPTYEDQQATLRTLSRQEDAKYTSAERSSDRTKRLTAYSHRTRRDRYNTFGEKLLKEYKEQAAFRAFTLDRLSREKNHWFAHDPKVTSLVQAIVEHCIHPRCLLSPMDADFCARFIKVLHMLGVPQFATLFCYDKLLGEHLSSVLFTCSEYEAKNYGRFLHGILADIYRWHQDSALFTRENNQKDKANGTTSHLPGIIRWIKLSQVPGDVSTENEWQKFQRIVRKWHRKLSKCLIECIETREFMHVYNAIVVLKEILPVFPLLDVSWRFGKEINDVVTKLIETEERGDLKILARAYSAALQKRQSFWLAPNNIHTEKTRPSSTPTAPATKALPVGPACSTPSRPHIQTVSAAPSPKPVESNLSSVIASIPRPDVVKRIRAEKASQSPKPVDVMAVDPTHSATGIESSITNEKDNGDLATSKGLPKSDPTSAALKELSQSPRVRPVIDEKNGRPDAQVTMAPPFAPSQTTSAQELRETAKQSISARPSDKSDEVRASSSSRRRSPSPPSRPGTRNASLDSRASGGKTRSDRGYGDEKRDRDTRSESRHESRDHNHAERRDSLLHNRNARSGPRDRTISGHSDRDEKEKERPRGRNERDKRERSDRGDRPSDRDRDLNRDHRDRHRRDEKEYREPRKERDAATRASNLPQEERAPPSRPDPSRNRAPDRDIPDRGSDDGLGKRRRPADDDPDRGSKRRNEKPHRDERAGAGRRTGEKDHERLRDTRDSDRRRPERGGLDAESRAPPAGHLAEKRSSDIAFPSSKDHATFPPSAPRAMSSSENRSRADGPSRDHNKDWKRDATSNGPTMASAAVPRQDVSGTPAFGSLQSRLGAAPSERPSERSERPSRGDSSWKNEDRDSRKRSSADREKDSTEHNETAPPPKRPRPPINRNRYPSAPGGAASNALFQKSLANAGGGNRPPRKD